MAMADRRAPVPLRIAIDGRYVQDRFPGIGRYTYNLVRALHTGSTGLELLVLHDPLAPNTRYDLAALGSLPGVRLLESASSPLALSGQWRFRSTLSRLAPDIFHAPHFLKPFYLSRPSIVTVQDLIPLTHPESLPSFHRRLLFRLALWRTCQTATAIIVPSDASRRDLLQFLPVPPGKVHLVPHGVDERFHPQPAGEIARVRRQYSLPERYVLQIGGNKPHKNLGRLMEAWGVVWGALRHGDRDQTRLVVAGPQDVRFPEAREQVRALGLDRCVLFVGNIAERDLPALYTGAALFVCPSLSEGFGLPVLEAMACGTPVVCSHVPALAGVAGHAAIMVDPRDVAGLAEAIRRLLVEERLREELRERGLSRARAFTWRITAAATQQVYQETAGR
jgi:glycosyltransferase involved in cell wall biosynthesis